MTRVEAATVVHIDYFTGRSIHPPRQYHRRQVTITIRLVVSTVRECRQKVAFNACRVPTTPLTMSRRLLMPLFALSQGHTSCCTLNTCLWGSLVTQWPFFAVGTRMHECVPQWARRPPRRRTALGPRTGEPPEGTITRPGKAAACRVVRAGTLLDIARTQQLRPA